MKKIIIFIIASVVFWCSMLYACGGHCDFNNSRYEEEVKIFDDAMYLYNEIGSDNITIEECISIAKSMYEIEKAKAGMNKMNVEK